MFKLQTIVVVLTFSVSVWAQAPQVSQEVQSVYPDSYGLYVDLHEHPELSSHETQTAAKLAAKLRSFGYEVTENVGGTGIVAVMKNGTGPVVMLRTELDALPVEEKTGLAYASKVHSTDPTGKDVPVMHACGHDLHMASLMGTAQVMAQTKNSWHGTLVIIGQPAEETISGAKAMVEDGVMTRFPKPDVAVALHVGNELPAGKVGVTPEFMSSNADSLRITIFGKGGHGSAPHTTIDPIVLGAKIVLALQTIASREVKPREAAVVTVGYFQAGTKNNIIPDQAQLGLTVRTVKPEVRKQVLGAIDRIVKGEAESAGVARMPEISHYESTDAVFNDPALAKRLTAVLEAALGKSNVEELPLNMGSEDFSYFVEQGVPGFYFALGGAEPEKYAQAKAAGQNLPSNHSSLFAPDVQPALVTGITAEVVVLRNLLNTTAEELKKLASEKTLTGE
jgi:hippurate hydrolase